MKILQIFGAVVAVHLLAFIFIFASPGCQSGPHNVPTPDATVPPEANVPDVSYNSTAATPRSVDTSSAMNYGGPSPSGTGHAAPTRPGSPTSVAVTPARVTEGVASVSTYTVVKGDSLWSIANRNQLTVAELARVNNITTSTALRPGKKLIIPVKPGAPAPKETASTPAAPTTPRPAETERAVATSSITHRVQSGESLGVIARRFGISVGELAAANNITDPSKVRAGQQLTIPASKSGRPPAAAAQPPVSSPAASRAAGTTPAPSTPPASMAAPGANTTATPFFEIVAPPPGQDLDAGLRETGPEVPTIRVEEAPTAPKN